MSDEASRNTEQARLERVREARRAIADTLADAADSGATIDELAGMTEAALSSVLIGWHVLVQPYATVCG